MGRFLMKNRRKSAGTVSRKMAILVRKTAFFEKQKTTKLEYPKPIENQRILLCAYSKNHGACTLPKKFKEKEKTNGTKIQNITGVSSLR